MKDLPSTSAFFICLFICSPYFWFYRIVLTTNLFSWIKTQSRQCSPASPRNLATLLITSSPSFKVWAKRRWQQQQPQKAREKAAGTGEPCARPQAQRESAVITTVNRQSWWLCWALDPARKGQGREDSNNYTSAGSALMRFSTANSWVPRLGPTDSTCSSRSSLASQTKCDSQRPPVKECEA